ncbi:MAG: response regulator, partial [bacterium]|nr:response regulator [bacterium]
MTRSLQAFSRPRKPQIRHIDTNALVEEVYRLLRRMIPATIDFQLDLDPHPCTVEVDPAQMQQLLVNLCVNARDAMPTGGTLVIQTCRVGPESLPALAKLEPVADRYARVRVSDDGCGMDAETLRRIFDPFFTTKTLDRGTGLGLAIVYQIVEAHRGVTDVASTPGKGTHFDIFFPVVAPTAPAEAADQILATVGEERILVVDDEHMVGSLLRTVLANRGYDVRVARRPEEALEIVRSASPPIDLALVDYTLPGMTGDRCLGELRRAQPGLKAILITGYDL